MVKKVFVSEDRKYYWNKGDFNSSEGLVKERDIKNGRVKSHIGKEFLVFDANFIDKIKKIKRGPAIMLEKDIGAIIANTGIDKNSKVVDAGTGCGVLAAFLANSVKEVYSYEINKKFFELAKENLKNLGLKNVKVYNKDIEEGIKERNVDLITLDLPEPWKVLKEGYKALKSGGFLVAYLPNITQVDKLIIEAKRGSFFVEKLIEIIEREWFFDQNRLRPKNQIIGHTAFLVFVRKV